MMAAKPLIDVPTIEFVENPLGAAKLAWVSEQAELVDVCDEVLAPIPFSCRSASCATCQIEVLEGLHLLEAPDAPEQELLEILQAPRNHRLACQVRVKCGEGKIRVRPSG
jgi:ferredoxin